MLPAPNIDCGWQKLPETSLRMNPTTTDRPPPPPPPLPPPLPPPALV